VRASLREIRLGIARLESKVRGMTQPDLQSVVAVVVARVGRQPGALLEVLHGIQNQFGYVPSETIASISHALNLSRAEVFGALSFYHYFRQSKPGKHTVQVCRAEACQARGGRAVERAVQQYLGIEYHQTSADGEYTLEPVYCLGNCACGPSIKMDDEVLGEVNAAHVASLFDKRRRSVAMAELSVSRPGGINIYISADIQMEASKRKLDLNIVRTGSRGLFWLEPMVEVETSQGRVAFGPLGVADVASLFDVDFLHGGAHPMHLGKVDDLAMLKKQTRITFERVGVIDPTDIESYVRHGGFVGWRTAQTLSPHALVQAVIDSGLRGRGGAAFPTGLKWQTVLNQSADQKYIACNADEGDSGTFADRMLIEGDPYSLIEGMMIAGRAVGASQGYIYLRIEYPNAQRVLTEAFANAYRAGYLGRGFDLQVRMGAGAYICGEETSMLESLEGKRGEVRVRPPLPAVKGLFGKPTVVNNVLTLASIPAIIARGAQQYASFGTGKSRGTLVLQLAGNIKHGGLIEVPFGISLREVLYDIGGGTASGRPIKTVQVGGPLGAYVPPSQFDVALDYESLASIGAMLGHGGIVVFDDSVDMAQMARYAMEFCAAESCGKCTPCRVGSTRGVELIDRIVRNEDHAQQIEKLNELCDTMLHGSLCGLGGMTPLPVQSALKYFVEDFSK
jgi:formate dehydrogenase iron-sulfur subunit